MSCFDAELVDIKYSYSSKTICISWNKICSRSRWYLDYKSTIYYQNAFRLNFLQLTLEGIFWSLKYSTTLFSVWYPTALNFFQYWFEKSSVEDILWPDYWIFFFVEMIIVPVLHPKLVKILEKVRTFSAFQTTQLSFLWACNLHLAHYVARIPAAIKFFSSIGWRS